MRLLFLLVLFPFTTFAQYNKAFVYKNDLYYSRLEYCGEGLFGFESNGKFGYMDANQKIIIPATLDLKLTSGEPIPAFKNGLAAVRSNGKYGVIDSKGKLVVPYDYNSITLYSKSKNVALVTKKENNKTFYGLLSTQNKVLIPVEYDDLSVDSNLVTVSQNYKYGLMDITGKKILPLEYKLVNTFSKSAAVKFEKDNKVGFTDSKGNLLFEKPKSVFNLYACFEGMILCGVNGKYGFLDMKGNEVIVTKYEYADNFLSNGLARVRLSNADTRYKSLYGYINKKGDVVIPIKYEYIGIFDGAVTIAQDPETNRYGFLDKTNKWVVKPIYLGRGDGFDENGCAWLKATDDQYHYINKAGKDFGSLDSLGKNTCRFIDGYAVQANTNYPYVLIDQNGKTIKILDDIDGIYNFSEKMAGYKSKNGLYGFIDINGNKIGKAEYNGFSSFSEGLSRVSKTINGKSKQGYANNKSELVIPFQFEDAGTFADGWALVTKDSVKYFIDKKGALNPLPRKYDVVNWFNDGYALGTIKNTNGLNTYYYINNELNEAFNITAQRAFSVWEGTFVAENEKVFSLYNSKGEKIKALDGISNLKFAKSGKLAAKKEKKWGYIDLNGNQAIPFQYDSCDSYVGDYAKVQLEGKWGIIDKNGKTIVQPEYKNIVPTESGYFIFLNNTWGIMDKTGKILCNEKFLTLTSIFENRALARIGKSYTILKSPANK